MTFLLRTAKYAIQDFWRNIWLSLITITVILFALFSFNSLVLVQTVSDYVLQTIEKKIDVSVFINSGIEENLVLDLRGRLLGLEQVKEVIYISADEALEIMIEDHKNDQAIIESLEELGGNPLGAQLIVQAQSSADYEPIVNLLDEPRYDAIIADKNFDEHRLIIERVSTISQKIRTVASIMTIFFTLIALIVVFNTLRIIIYTHKEEIAIMRLVGATNWFIRMPYIWESIIYALMGVLIFLLIWYPILGVVQPFIDGVFVDGTTIDLIHFYNANALYLFGLQILGLIVLLAVASIIATRKYSRV